MVAVCCFRCYGSAVQDCCLPGCATHVLRGNELMWYETSGINTVFDRLYLVISLLTRLESLLISYS